MTRQPITATLSQHDAFAVRYQNHGVPVPELVSRSPIILENQHSQALIQHTLYERDFNELVPKFLRGVIQAPQRVNFDISDNYALEREGMIRECMILELYRISQDNNSDAFFPAPDKKLPIIAQMMLARMPRFSLEKLLYKSAGSAVEYLRCTADSEEYTNPKNFQTLFESALAQNVFANRDGQPLIAAHAGAGFQESVWIDMIKKKHRYNTTPTYTDDSPSMLKICKAFNPDADVCRPGAITKPSIYILNNGLPNMHAHAIPEYISSLNLPRGSLVFATAVTETTDTTPEFYYHADTFFGAMIEDLFFLPRKNLKRYVEFSKSGSGSNSRLATEKDRDDLKKYGYLEEIIPGKSQVNLIAQIDINANFKRPIPLSFYGGDETLEMPKAMHVISSHRLEEDDMKYLRDNGAEIIRDKDNSSVALVFNI